MAVQITPKQSMRARSLLKWNIYDLANRTHVQPGQIDRFEKGLSRLMRPDNDTIVKAYKKEGIIFLENMEVRLVDPSDIEFAEELSGNDTASKDRAEEGADINFDAKEKTPLRDRPWVHSPEYTGPDRRDKHSQTYYSGTERRRNRKDLLERVRKKYMQQENPDNSAQTTTDQAPDGSQ